MDINTQKLVDKLEKLIGTQIKMQSYISPEGTIYKFILDLNHMPASYDYGRQFIKPEEYMIGVQYVVPKPYMDLMDYNNIEVNILFLTYRLDILTSIWNLKSMRGMLKNNSYNGVQDKFINRGEFKKTEMTVKFKDVVKTMENILETQANNFKNVIEIVTDPTIDVMFDKISDIQAEIREKQAQMDSIEKKMTNMLKANIGMKEDFG